MVVIATAFPCLAVVAITVLAFGVIAGLVRGAVKHGGCRALLVLGPLLLLVPRFLALGGLRRGRSEV